MDGHEFLEYYTNAWDNSGEYERGYRLAYQIATCYYHLDDETNAAQWYQKFLEGRWDVKDWQRQADFARQYLEFRESRPADANDHTYPSK